MLPGLINPWSREGLCVRAIEPPLGVVRAVAGMVHFGQGPELALQLEGRGSPCLRSGRGLETGFFACKVTEQQLNSRTGGGVETGMSSDLEEFERRRGKLERTGAVSYSRSGHTEAAVSSLPGAASTRFLLL